MKMYLNFKLNIMIPEAKIILCILICVGISFVYLLFRRIKNSPIEFNNSWVGTTFYVFSHKGSIAEMTPIEWLNPNKKNGKKFIIPDSFGKLETGKTYELLQNEASGYYVKKVAVML